MIVVKRALCGALDALGIGANHALQPTAGRCKTSSQHVYEVRPRKDKRGVDLISDALPFGRLWYGEPDAISNAISFWACSVGTGS
jgi:hypothetical protein